MPYSKSKALKQFELATDSLLAKCSECKSAKVSYDLKTLAFQGVILLTCSSLENYLKSLVDDWIFQLKFQNATMANIPDKTRRILYIRNQSGIFKGFTFSGNESEASSKIKFDQFAFLLSVDSALIPSYMKGVHIYVNKKYPSIENIKKIFSTLAIEDIFRIMHTRFRKNYSLYLESFLGIRESLAHEFPPDVSYFDAKRQLTNMRTMTRKIDSIAFSHLSKNSGNRYWPA